MMMHFKLKAVEDAETTTNRAAARKVKVDHDIHASSNNTVNVFVTALK